MKQTKDVLAQPLSTAEAHHGRAPMILRSTETVQPASWQQQWSQAYGDVHQLCRDLNLNPEQLDIDDSQRFGLRVPHSFVAKMTSGQALDPLLLQVLPRYSENNHHPGFVADPLQESRYNPVAGVIHKYQGRVLITATGSCAVHCRYCFRRHFPYGDNNSSHWPDILSYLQQHSDISEVILSGGDPLALSDKHLKRLLNDLAAIKHVQRIRIHTRFPIMIPERLTTQLLETISNLDQVQFLVVLHSNHAAELDHVLEQRLLPYQQAGICFFNQAVLLRQVNDNLEALSALHQKLFRYRIIPYYLHLLDPVQGASHFEVPESEALDLYQQLQAQLPGYLIPKLVRDLPGRDAKTVLLP